jgi:hypothetical protein
MGTKTIAEIALTMNQLASSRPASIMEGITETKVNGFVLLSPNHTRPRRRVLFVNSYGGPAVWEKMKKGLVPYHHLWGCFELVRMGYEVALATPLDHFYLHRRPLPHDLKFLSFVRHWLGPDDIIYCGHTLLYWLPLLRSVGVLRRPIVSLTYAREHLHFSRAHSAIIALTAAAADHAAKMAPKVRIAHLSWGCDLGFFPQLPYQPECYLSCGITLRDHRTLCSAAALCTYPIRLICPGIPQHLIWPSNVEVIDGGKGWNVDDKAVSYRELLLEHYARSAGSLIIINNDPTQYTAVGFTNLLETMAMSRPAIFTRTGAVPTEIDVEKAGCGLLVPPENPGALAEAIKFLSENPRQAQAMGDAGRRLCETHYNTDRYATELHRLFESL